ncbi:hypothetical protein BJ165DRAFT_1402994 [Panaeolus papilionaceus]|nr:hypothetical protein BJ165DRAFT_1402994 [Panaeolus papilionaceus]
MSSRLSLMSNVVKRHPELYETGSSFLLQIENTLFWVDRKVFAQISVTWNELFERDEPYPMSGVGTLMKPAAVSCGGALTAKSFQYFLRWMRYGPRKTYSSEDLLDIMSVADYWVSSDAQQFVYDRFEDMDAPPLFLLDLACKNNGDEYIRRFVNLVLSTGETSVGVDMVDQRISMQILRARVRITNLIMTFAATPPRIPMHYTCSDHDSCKALWQKDWNFLYRPSVSHREADPIT